MLRIWRIINFVASAPLNKKRKISAITRFVKWQLVSRLHRGKFVVSWIDDARLIVGGGETGLTGNIYAGLMEFDDMAFILCALRSDDTFIDIGANAGAYTVLASKLCGARTYSFEPIPSTFNRLLDQVNLNAIGEFTVCMNVGLGDKRGKVNFTLNNDTTNKVAVSSYSGETVEVEVMTLDDVRIDLSGSAFVKIDVEGFEMQVLRGAEKTLRDEKLEAVIVELNGSGKSFGIDDIEIHKKLLEFGLKPVEFDGLTREMQYVDSFKLGGNTIYVKDIDKMKRRCVRGVKRAVHTVGGVSI